VFVGGVAGVALHAAIPGVPLGLAFTCMLASVPGALVSAPFSMVLFAVFITQVGRSSLRPSSSPWSRRLTTEGVKYFLVKRNYAGGHGTTTSTS